MGEQMGEGRRTSGSPATSNPEYEEIKGVADEGERPIRHFSKYAVKDTAIPNQPRGIDIFTPTQAGGNLTDIFYAGDQRVDP